MPPCGGFPVRFLTFLFLVLLVSTPGHAAGGDVLGGGLPVLRPGEFVSDHFAISLRLKPHGAYEIHVDRPPTGPPSSERGKWSWDKKRRELLLERTEGDWLLGVRRIKGDPKDANVLIWLSPLKEGAEGSEPVKFRRVMAVDSGGAR